MYPAKHLITLLLTLTITSGLFAQNDTIVTDSINSKILKNFQKFNVYLPPSYADSTAKKFPVVYLLHGLGGTYSDWGIHGNLKNQISTGIIDSILPEMVIIMPGGETSYYMNNIKKEYEYEDFFFKELIPYAEQKFRCISTKESRGIAGLSMGGFGTLLYAFHHPDMFVAASALSPAVRTDKEMISMSDKGFAERYKTPFGEFKTPAERINDFYNKNSIIYLAEHLPDADKGKVKLYIDIGDDDYLYAGNSTLHMVLRNKKIPHEYRVRDGGHNWDYWKSGFLNALTFISVNFDK